MKSEYSTEAAVKAAKAIRKRAASQQPTFGIILGSGLGGLSKSIGDAVRIPFGDIPGFPEVTVAGHEGAMIVGTLGGREIVALSGRFHMYEGHPAALAAFPVRVFHALGARDLFVSNAAGGISARLAVGDLMMISDHLNLMGSNPLVGETREGEIRFPDMTDAYNPGLRWLLRTTAEKLGITLREGIYAGLLGPSYETPSGQSAGHACRRSELHHQRCRRSYRLRAKSRGGARNDQPRKRYVRVAGDGVPRPLLRLSTVLGKVIQRSVARSEPGRGHNGVVYVVDGASHSGVQRLTRG